MKAKLLLGTAAAVAMIAGPAAACDLDGMPGFGGAHRFSPFAQQFAQAEPPPPPSPQAGDPRDPAARPATTAQTERPSDEERSAQPSEGRDDEDQAAAQRR